MFSIDCSVVDVNRYSSVSIIKFSKSPGDVRFSLTRKPNSILCISVKTGAGGVYWVSALLVSKDASNKIVL